MRIGAGWILTTSLAAAAIAGPPSLKDRLGRIGAYVESYGEKASIVVASERYTQRVSSMTTLRNDARTTVAEFAIVKTPGANIDKWVGFRDVVEVDGKPVTDRADRLIELLTSGSGTDEARRLSEESSRFNIGDVRRNFNVPTTALFLFLPENFNRFRFTTNGAAADGPAEIAYRETSRPTFMHSLAGASIPIHGSIWASPEGTVVRTVMRLQSAEDAANIAADVDVTYAQVPALQMWLPATMTETYLVIRKGVHFRIDCRAEYSNYRTFHTSVRIK